MTTDKIMTDERFNATAVARLSEKLAEPTWLHELRRNAWAGFTEMDWPTYQEETWRRTRLTGLQMDRFQPWSDETRVRQEIWQQRLDEMESDGALVHDNGILLQENLPAELLDRGVVFTDLLQAAMERPQLVQRYLGQIVAPGTNKFTALHYAFLRGGTFLYVPRGVEIALPLQSLVSQSAPDLAGFHHTLIVTEDGAAVTLVEEFIGGGNGFHDGVVEVHLGMNSSLHYLHIQEWDTEVWNFSTQRVVQTRDSRYQALISSWGSRLSKLWKRVDLEEPGGQAELLGLYFPTGHQHIDHHTIQNHISARCSSDLLFKGALREHGRSVYQGSIKVWPGAQKTDAYQSNQNLLLDPMTRADSIPALEIDADDVRCSHGATVSEVPEDYIFYLQARGLTRQQAMRMIVHGFFESIIDRVDVEAVRDKLESIVTRKLGI